MNEPATDAAVPTLLAAVARRLWLERVAVAARGALWAWAAVMAGAAVMHLVAGRPGFLAAAALGAAAWLAALAWAAMQRPGRAESALYADRFLGGASGYSTLLEAGATTAARDGAPALRWLAQWAAAAAPASRRALDARRAPSGLARPLATAGIGTVVAAIVMALPAEPLVAMDTPTAAVGGAVPQAEPLSLDESALAETLAAELATQVPPDDPGRGSMGPSDGAAVAGPVGTTGSDAPTAASAASARRAATGEPVARGSGLTGAGEAAGVEIDGERPGQPGLAPAPGTGREAGASRDDAAAGERSRALQGPLTVVRRDVNRRSEADRRADMEQGATYVDDATASDPGPSAAVASVAAARPPAARREARLSPVEAAYVADWRAAQQEAP